MRFVLKPEEGLFDTNNVREVLVWHACREKSIERAICHWRFCPRSRSNFRDRLTSRYGKDINCPTCLTSSSLGYIYCISFRRRDQWNLCSGGILLEWETSCRFDCHIYYVRVDIFLAMTWSISHCLCHLRGHHFSLSPVILWASILSPFLHAFDLTSDYFDFLYIYKIWYHKHDVDQPCNLGKDSSLFVKEGL